MAEGGKHWAGIGEAGTLLGMKSLLLAYRLFGRTGFRILLLPVMTYFYLRRRQARQASRAYLRRVARQLPPEQRAGLTPFRHFWGFGEILLDKLLVWMGHIRPRDVIFETPAAFDEVDQGRSGGIIIVSHLGNTEVCSALAHQLPDIAVTMLVHTRHAEKFNRLMKQAHGHASISLMQVTEMSPATAMVLAERVEAGEYIVIAGDRTPVQGGGRTSTATFLGEEAEFPQGAFILASLLRCPLYLMFCLKQSGRYHLYLERFSRRLVLPRGQREAGLQRAVQAYADRLAAYCRKAPLQWFNFFPFWLADQHAAGPDKQDKP
ncbi:lipid A biosynthesis acyltransferase [Oceanimonas doudoroffii]|uniref:Lipid A biosynthesis acyltransferase n=1 Tax=Oceanimonas doudoroffii TaxID=84158 RepID=A0A233RCC9_9GAMM|nr:lipid A biosynthesis acyltransferase [Oceanimonas doudoroffii]OXY81031.1 lipid A biosynthesis acyltransferase [Oceanimonas doudoroffii]